MTFKEIDNIIKEIGLKTSSISNEGAIYDGFGIRILIPIEMNKFILEKNDLKIVSVIDQNFQIQIQQVMQTIKTKDSQLITFKLLEQKGFPHINYGIEIPFDPLNQIRLIKSGENWYPQLEQTDEITGKQDIVTVKSIMFYEELQRLYYTVYGKYLE